MSHWSSLRGHITQQEMFRRAMERGRMSQAYLFVGPDGIGKQLFARKLAQSLLCRNCGSDPIEACGECSSCRPFVAGSHPDFLFVGCPEGKTKIPIAAIIGDDERRGREGLCHDLYIRPLEGSRKVVVLDGADLLGVEAANSFLKSLEEPPERAVLLLIASNLDAVLPTIRSRCQLMRFSALSKDDVVALLQQQGLAQSEGEARFAASLSEGSLTVARQLLEPELASLRTSLYQALSQPNFSGMALSKTLFEEIGRISSDTPQQRVNVHWIIRFVIEFYRSALWELGSRGGDSKSDSAASGPERIAEASGWVSRREATPETFEVLSTLIERAVQGARHIDQNLAVALTFESLFDDLGRIARTATR